MNIGEHIEQFEKYYRQNKRQYWLDDCNNEWVKKAYQDRNDLILTLVRNFNAKTILDIGCGTGDLIKLLQNDQRQVVGVEPTVINCIKCRENTGCLAYRSCAEDLPFRDEIFDMAIMADVIEHVENPVRALQESFRVVRPRGQLIITTPNKWADIIWSIGSKNLFRKLPVKENLYSKYGLYNLIYQSLDNFRLIHTTEGIYPRSRVLCWLFKPGSNTLKILGKWELLRYRQIVIIGKVAG